MATDDAVAETLRRGRVARAVPVALLAVRQALGRLANKLTRDEQKRLDRLTREAERYVAVLGEMKGVAMKVGQLVSFLDAGSIPEEHRAAYRQIVGALQADAPPMPFETVRAVVEQELGRPVAEVFDWLGERPMAAASIGQVHSARLLDGRAVVVKVQYPGVADAIRADLQNSELIASMARLGSKLSPIRMAPDPSAIAEEITERITEELDYRIEAANQTSFAVRYRGHPTIRIPEVVEELSTERILVMDEHDGMRWTAALDQPQERKDAWGEVIYRFVWGSLYDLGAFNGDPHPGNYLFHEDGGVTFLDFGCVKRFDAEQIEALHRIADSVTVEGGDAAALHRCFVDVGFLKEGRSIDEQRLLEWWSVIWDPSEGASPFTFTPDVAAAVISRNFDVLGEWAPVVRRVGLTEQSKDWTFLTRIQVGLYSVLGALGATADWRVIHHELRRPHLVPSQRGTTPSPS